MLFPENYWRSRGALEPANSRITIRAEHAFQFVLVLISRRVAAVTGRDRADFENGFGVACCRRTTAADIVGYASRASVEHGAIWSIARVAGMQIGGNGADSSACSAIEVIVTV